MQQYSRPEHFRQKLALIRQPNRQALFDETQSRVNLAPSMHEQQRGHYLIHQSSLDNMFTAKLSQIPSTNTYKEQQ